MAVRAFFNLIKRGVRGWTKVALNTEPVDVETLIRRRNICAGCGHATRTKATGIQHMKVLTPTSTCSLCHCAIAAKVKLAGETCPLDKWPEPVRLEQAAAEDGA